MTTNPRWNWPDIYTFGYVVGPTHNWFAWYPVRLWYGEVIWLQSCKRARIVKHDYLDGPDWSFWTYDKYRKTG